MTDSALYTRTGDAGQTSLGSGRRVPKTNGTLEVLGNIDELESAIGLAKASVPQGDFNLQEGLSTVQKQLLVLKEDLRSFGSTVRSSGNYGKRIGNEKKRQGYSHKRGYENYC